MHLTPDDLADLESDADAILRLAREDHDDLPDLAAVCRALTGGAPQLHGDRVEGRTRKRDGVYRVEVRLDIYGTPRGRQVLGHELAHVWFAKHRPREEPSEDQCDALGVFVACPRRAVRAAMAHLGHRVHRLAEALHVEQPAALLRLGEVADRSVLFVRRPGVLVMRGEPREWPPVERVLRDRPAGVHPIRVGDRWGLMAA